MLTIFHISDLHLAESISASYLDSNISTVSKSQMIFHGHDIKIWVAFRDHILNRIRHIDCDFRICVTGDLSRIGHIRSFNLAKELFYKDSDSDISKEFGLRIEKEKFYIVPGNHDSYDKSFVKRNNLRTFNGIFYPTLDEQPYPIIKEESISNNKITFINLDTTYKKNAIKIMKKLGRGLVSNSQLDQIKGFFKSKSTSSIKILCMHHSPIILDKKHDRALMLEKSHELLSVIVKYDIDIILCGHIHDDFYDLLPLKTLVKKLPRKRGWGRVIRNIYKETQLNDYHQIVIKGKKARFYDSLAYYYIKERSNVLDEKKDEFTSLEHFRKYVTGHTEYREFVEQFNNFSSTETALIISGSTCQEKEDSNSYIELQIEENGKNISIKRHKYNSRNNQFETKERALKFK